MKKTNTVLPAKTGYALFRELIWKVMQLTMIQLTMGLIFCSLAVANNSHAQEVLNRELSLNLKQVSLRRALAEIETATKVKFVYSRNHLKLEEKVTVTAENKKLGDVLNDLLASRSILYQVQDNNDYIVLTARKNKSQASSNGNEEVGTTRFTLTPISGKVTDSNGQPLPGVSVLVKGTTTGTATDVNGKYKLEVSDANALLIFSLIGYKTEEVPVGTQTVIDVMMAVDVKFLEEVVILGYGTQKKINLTGAVTSVTSKNFDNRPVTNVVNALQGTMAGVTVTTTNGQPGRDGGTIRIRGIGTGLGSAASSSSPMVVVDGVIATMSEVNPDDVETVTVLKDAASAAIYGSRAANGVVLITTKKGKSGIQIQYNAYVGKQDITRLPDFLPSWQQASLYNEALTNERKTPKWTADDIEKFKNGTDPTRPDTDWLKLFYTEPGIQQNHHLSMKGGDEKTKYMFSLGYFNQDGNVKGTNFKRYSTRVNIHSQVTKKILINVNLAYQYSPFSEPVSTYATGFSQLIRQINRVSNTVPYKYPNGAYGYVADGSPMAWLEAGSYNKTQNSTLTSNIGFDWEIVKNLHFKPAFGYRTGSGLRQQFVKDIQYYSGSTGVAAKYQGPNNLTNSSDKTTYTNLQAILDYEKSFESGHTFSVLLGASQEYQLYNYLYAYRQGFLNNELTEMSVAPKEGQQNDGYSNDWALQSYFGRLNYNYQERYLFEANLRRDGSSRFAKGNQWGVFPSFSAGWNIANESFFGTLTTIVSALKLRASWGKLGNQSVVGNYPAIATIASGQNYSFNQSLATGIAPTNGANQDITWEATTTSNIGLDASFLNDKLDLTIDYFQRNTSNILLALPVGAVYGINAPYQNAGSVSNKGWEFSTKYRGKMNKVSFDISGNFTVIQNTITDLKGSGPYISGGTVQQEGYPINSLYGYICEGIFRTQAEIDAHAKQSGGTIEPGDLKYKDISGPDGVPDGKIDGADRTYLGTYFPKVTYGVIANAAWKGLEVSLFFQGAAGVKTMAGTLIGRVGPDVDKPTQVFLDRWTPDNPDASFPRLWYGFRQNDPGSNPSSFWIKNSSYLRLKNVTVAYTIPASFTRQIGLKNLKVYYSGQNLLTLTRFYKWIDPEVGSAGSIYNYPQVLVNTVGVNVTF